MNQVHLNALNAGIKKLTISKIGLKEMNMLVENFNQNGYSMKKKWIEIGDVAIVV